MDKQFHQLSLAIASSFVVVLMFLVDLGLFNNSNKEIAQSPQPTIKLERSN